MYDKFILIVDDEQELLTLIKTIFERAGYTKIMTATSGEMALQIIRETLPDMVILDVMLPGMDGFEVLQEIRALSKLPVLMLTAKDAAEDRFSGFELGADDYLIKPFLPKELLLRVQAILKRSYPTEKRIIELENSFIDIDKAEIHRENKIIPLTAKEYNILL